MSTYEKYLNIHGKYKEMSKRRILQWKICLNIKGKRNKDNIGSIKSIVFFFFRVISLSFSIISSFTAICDDIYVYIFFLQPGPSKKVMTLNYFHRLLSEPVGCLSANVQEEKQKT